VCPLLFRKILQRKEQVARLEGCGSRHTHPAQAEKDDRAERADRTIENNPEYAALYFVA
jgi:hypothetical protein